MTESNAFVKINDYDTENKLLLKEKVIYYKTVAKKINKINTLKSKIEYDELKYHFKSTNRTTIRFNSFKRPLNLIRKIKDGSIDLENTK